jgi:hypothetical protein
MNSGGVECWLATRVAVLRQCCWNEASPWFSSASSNFENSPRYDQPAAVFLVKITAAGRKAIEE